MDQQEEQSSKRNKLQNPAGYNIPKCISTNQFFTLGNIHRKKRNHTLRSSRDINISRSAEVRLSFDGQSVAGSEKEFASSDILTNVTEGSRKETGVNFRNKVAKQKMNRIDPIINQFSKKKQLHQPKPPMITLPRPSFPSLPSLDCPSPPLQLSNFQLVFWLGSGRSSSTYLAIQKNTNFLCSIKCIPKSEITNQNRLNQLIRELKIQHYLSHQHIVALYAEFSDHHFVYLVMEFCTDGDLDKLLSHRATHRIRSAQEQGEQGEEQGEQGEEQGEQGEEQGAGNRVGENTCIQNYGKGYLNQDIDVVEVADIVKQLCLAVEVMHKQRIMHRDIKPQNVFITMGKFVKLGDFGWSTSLGPRNLRETICGTPLYLPPQLVLEQQYSCSIDIWSIGILTYQLLTGRVPFQIQAQSDLQKILYQNINYQCIQDQIARHFVQTMLVRDVGVRADIYGLLAHGFLIDGDYGDEEEEE